MKRCSIQPKDRIFIKGYGFLSFAENMSKNIGKSISNNLGGQYSKSLLLIMLNNLQQMHLNLVLKK